MNLNKLIENKLNEMEGQEIDLNLTLKLHNLSLQKAENQKKKKKGKPWISCEIMAVLNSQENNISKDSTNQASTQGQEQGMAQASQQSQQSQVMGGPGDALNQGSSLLGDANRFLQQINQLMENPVVKNKIAEKMSQGQAQQRQGEPVMDQNGQVSRGGAPAREPERAPRSENSVEKKKETPEIKPEDLDLFEIFQAKIFDPEQREEMAQDLDKVGQVLQDELNGMNTTLEELQEYLRSDELQEYFEEMGIDQWNQKKH